MPLGGRDGGCPRRCIYGASVDRVVDWGEFDADGLSPLTRWAGHPAGWVRPATGPVWRHGDAYEYSGLVCVAGPRPAGRWMSIVAQGGCGGRISLGGR